MGEGLSRNLCSQVERCRLVGRCVGGMVGTQTEVSKNEMCTHKETGIRGVVGIYEKRFGLDDDAGL